MRAPNRLIDTSALAPKEREAAAREFLETITDVDVVGHACPPEAVRTRLRSWDLHNFQLNVLDSPWLQLRPQPALDDGGGLDRHAAERADDQDHWRAPPDLLTAARSA